MAVKFHILLLNGPNLNMLGTREPEKYGPLTLAEIVNRLTSEAAALNVSLDHLQRHAAKKPDIEFDGDLDPARRRELRAG